MVATAVKHPAIDIVIRRFGIKMALQLNGPGNYLTPSTGYVYSQKCQSAREISSQQGSAFDRARGQVLTALRESPTRPVPALIARDCGTVAESRGAQTVHAQPSYGADDGIDVEAVGPVELGNAA